MIGARCEVDSSVKNTGAQERMLSQRQWFNGLSGGPQTSDARGRQQSHGNDSTMLPKRATHFDA